jgi:hypothetical protein
VARVAPAVRRPRWRRIAAGAALVVAAILALGYATRVGIDAYRASLTLSGLSDDATPVPLTVAGERLTIPRNMLRDAAVSAGSDQKQADLVLHWPSLEGYSKSLAADFKDGSASAPLVYVTIGPRTVPLDAAARLENVYARYFVGDALPAPEGLTARRLSLDSGYDGEIVYFAAGGADRFVARCLADAAPETPATCLRDIGIGRNMTLLYRFNRDIVRNWKELDAGMHVLADRILAGE